ncbi:MAG: type VII secretion protein EssC, partial [Eubacteriales bacterium]|nr:type VII secretion protein EssC [Eubacteriales bacterium]
MSIVLMIYSRSACREYVLPAIHNEEFFLAIDSAVFGLGIDSSIHLEEARGKWFFLSEEGCEVYSAEESTGRRRDGSRKVPGQTDTEEETGPRLLGSPVHSARPDRVQLLNGANYMLDLGGERLAVIVRFKETSFVSYKKYLLSAATEISIGRSPGNMIQYSYSYGGNQYIGRSMAVIRLKRDAALLIDENSKNGLYVNDHRVKGSHSLQFGDHIHIWGLDMVYLGRVLAIRDEEELKVNTAYLRPCMPETEQRRQEKAHKGESSRIPGTPAAMSGTNAASGERPEPSGEHRDLPAQPEDAVPYKRVVYHRAPRSMEAIDTEKVEIEQPPSKREAADPNLLLTIGPSMTMAVPMALGSGLAILGTRMNGGTASLFMYTGIITAIGAALIGAFWALMNLNYSQKKVKQEEVHRFEAYSEYLIRCSDRIKHSYVGNAEALRKMYPTAAFCVTPEMEAQNLLWGRNSTHADFLAHRIGIGDIPFQVPIDVPKERFTLMDDSLNEKPRLIRDSYRTLHDVPICIDLLQENIIGIVGGPGKAGAYEVFYDLVAQIASQNSYTDVKMAFLFSGEGDHEQGRERWDFLRWLPHTWSQDRRIRYFASGQSEIADVLYALSRILRDRSERRNGTPVTGEKHIYKPHYVLFVEDGSILEGELINTFLTDRDADLGVTLVLLAESYEELPNTCECIIGNEDGFRGLYRVREGTREKIEFDSVSPEALNRFARHLSNLEVNEVETGGDIPGSITFFEMYGITRLEELGVVDRWRKNRTYTSMRALVGHMAGGAPCYLDVHEKYHGPHGLVAGTTGSGKSETLQTYILSLAINFSPDDVGFFLIDYKGGGMANLFEGLPHLMGTISNLSGNQVTRAMVSIKSENRRRQRLFNESGVNNINAYTQLYKNGEAKVPVPHLFIIIDEFAELKREQSDFMKELISVAQVGRSLGVHLILATQKPAGTVDDNIWSNSKFRLCLRVQERQDSLDMLHKPDAAYLTQAGRCYLQVGNDELYELFQSGWSGAVYDETDANAQRTLATMLTGTGKAALMGSYVKRRQKEIQKERWIAGLLEILDRCAAQSTREPAHDRRNTAGIPGDSDEGGSLFMDRYFQMLGEEGVDYPDNEFNRRAVAFLMRMNRLQAAQNLNWKRLSTTERARVLLELERGQKSRLPEQKDRTQLDAVIEYLAQTAEAERYEKPQKLWLPVLPSVLPLDALVSLDESADFPEVSAGFDGKRWPARPAKWALRARIGMYDDPANQAQEALEISFTESGNIAVCGIQGSGRSTALQTILYSFACSYSPQYLGFYILDFSSRMLACFEEDPHCGGVLYEEDIENVNKFFNMIATELKRRRELFSGGNYYQYVMKNGVSVPALIIAIDNYAGFREKTGGAYDERMMQLTRDCNACGIYFLLSAAGYNKDEIPNRMHDNIHYTIALEMLDQFAYGDVLGVMRVQLLPENGIPGRGLVPVSGGILEFQMAVAADAGDDYQRGELLEDRFRRMAAAWQGQ